MEAGKEAVQSLPTQAATTLRQEPQPPAEAVQSTPAVSHPQPTATFAEQLPKAPSVRKTSTEPPPIDHLSNMRRAHAPAVTRAHAQGGAGNAESDDDAGALVWTDHHDGKR